MSSPEQTRLKQGDKLDFYKVIRPIGAGGMGFVYLAEDERLTRKVALKVISRHDLGQKEAIERFLNEARVLAQVQHPNIVNIFGIGEAQGFIYIAMEYIEGASLHQLIHQGRLSLLDGLNIIRHVAEGLGAAHKAGLIHRDIKPANILVDPSGRAKLIDFGIAKQKQESKGLTETGMLIGTLNYMAPELFRSEPASIRSDFYALGLVLYEIIVSQSPFAASSQFAIMENIRQGVLDYPIQLRPLLPESAIKLIEWTTHRDPARRPLSAEAIVQETGKVLRDLAQTAPRLNKSILLTVDQAEAKEVADQLKALSAPSYLTPLAHLIRKKGQTLEAFLDEHRSGKPIKTHVIAPKTTNVPQATRRTAYTATPVKSSPSPIAIGGAIALILGLLSLAPSIQTVVKRNVASVAKAPAVPIPHVDPTTLAPGTIQEPPVGEDPWPPVPLVYDKVGTFSIGRMMEVELNGGRRFKETFIKETITAVRGDIVDSELVVTDVGGTPVPSAPVAISQSTMGGWMYRQSIKNSPDVGDASISYIGDPAQIFPLRKDKIVRFDMLIKSSRVEGGFRQRKYCKTLDRKSVVTAAGRFDAIQFNCYEIGSDMPPDEFYFSPEINWSIRNRRFRRGLKPGDKPIEMIWELQKLERAE